MSKRFPAWFLGRFPDRDVIAASYNLDLARDFGREVRNIVNERDYANVFGSVIAPDSQAADRWNTRAGGGYVAAGVGTAITGRGAHVLIIDDPFKDRQDADSELMRERVWGWYRSTAYTRLAPGGAIIVVNTRWHEDDLSGRALEEEAKGGDRWRKLILPALDDSRGPLWPERFDAEALGRIRHALGTREWSALYQQDPTPDEGTYFQRAWFGRAEPPGPRRVYITGDFAVTDGNGDFTEFAVWGIAPSGDVYALDWWHGQTAADVWIERLLDLIVKHKPLAFFGEAGPIRRAIEGVLRRRMRERKAFCRIEWVASTRDKPTRARGFQARASSGRVFFPQAEWADRIVEQLVAFPAGKHDDAVDVCALMGLVLDEAHPAIVEAQEAPQKRDIWDDDDDDDATGWKVQ